MKPRLAWVVAVLSTIGISVLAVGLVTFHWTRFEAIEEIVSRAQAESSVAGDRIDALLSLALSEEAPLKERNRAIWALGELHHGEVLPELRELDRFETCDHATRICVRELRKAIRKLSR